MLIKYTTKYSSRAVGEALRPATLPGNLNPKVPWWNDELRWGQRVRLSVLRRAFLLPFAHLLRDKQQSDSPRHPSVSRTLDTYGHLFPIQKQEAAEAIDQLLKLSLSQKFVSRNSLATFFAYGKPLGGQACENVG